MSAEGPRFEIEPPAETPEDAPVPVRRSRLRREKKSKAPKERQGKPSWVRRLATPFVSPASYYLIGLLLLGATLWAMFNPDFGEIAKWPHEVLDGPTWDWTTARLIAIALPFLGCLVALCFRAGPKRGLMVACLTGFPLVLFHADTGAFVLPIAMALAAGALIALPGRETARKAVLLVALTAMAAYLFMPWPVSELPEGQGSNYNAAQATLAYYQDRPEDAGANTLAGHLPATIALLLGFVGFFALLGIATRACRVAGGFLMVALVIAWSVTWYLHGQNRGDGSELAAWQDGLRALADKGHAASILYALPFAGALADLVRGRGEADA